MTPSILAFLVIFSLPVHAAAADSILEQDCARRSGTLVETWQCPSSDWHREGPFCEIRDSDGVSMFFNGCNSDVAGFGSVFHFACVHHDLCYHHEPVTSGKDKLQCDLQFRREMNQICKSEGAPFGCEVMAEVYYQAVRVGADKSWSCSKVPAKYDEAL